MTTALNKRQAVDGFMTTIVNRRQTFSQLLPEGMDAEQFIAEVRVAVARTPALMNCESLSVLDAITTCAQLGLSPSGRLGSAYLIPYKERCTLVVGYRGYLDLAYRSGEVQGFQARTVHEKDIFEYEEGLEPKIKHIPSEEADPGKLRAVYAVAALKGGYKTHVVMLRREVEAIRSRSWASRSGPWQTDEAEMWKKTAIRRLIKLLPLSPAKAKGLYRAVEVEDAEFEAFDPETGEIQASKSGVSAVRAQLHAGLTPERIDAAAEAAIPA